MSELETILEEDEALIAAEDFDPLENPEILTNVDPDLLFKELQQLQSPFQYKEPPALSTMTSFIKGKVPLASTLGGGASNSAATISKLAEGPSNLTQGFHTAAFAFSALDFLRVPALYFSAWAHNEKIPATASKNARFAYASILMGMAITALAFPPAAPVIALATASLGFAASVFHLGRYFVQRSKYRKEFKEVTAQVEEKQNELLEIQKEAQLQELLLSSALAADDQAQVLAIQKEIPALMQRRQDACEQLQEFTARQKIVEQKVAKYGSARLLDKGVGVGLASLGLAGVALSLFFPPLGGAIVAAATLAGFAYLTGRFVAPYVKNFVNWIGSKFKSNKEEQKGTTVLEEEVSPKARESLIEHLDEEEAPLLEDAASLEHPHRDSTAEVLMELNPNHLPLHIEEEPESPESSQTPRANNLNQALIDTDSDSEEDGDGDGDMDHVGLAR